MLPKYYRVECEEKAMFFLEQLLGVYENRIEGGNPDFYRYEQVNNNLYKLTFEGYSFEDNIIETIKKYPSTIAKIINYQEKTQTKIYLSNNKIKEEKRKIHYDEINELKYISYNYKEEWINTIITIEENKNDEYCLYIEDFNNNKKYNHKIINNEYKKLKNSLNKLVENNHIISYLNSDYKKGELLEINYKINENDNMYIYFSNEINCPTSTELSYNESKKYENLINNFIKKYNTEYEINLTVERNLTSKQINLSDIDDKLIKKINNLLKWDYYSKYKDINYHNTIILYIDEKILGLVGYEYDYDSLIVTEYIINVKEKFNNKELIKKEIEKYLDKSKYNKTIYECEFY